MVERDEHDDGELAGPQLQRLRDDLTALYAPDIEVPRQVDDAVLGQATRHFARHRRRRFLLRAVAGGVAAGAVAASILWAVWFGRPGELDRAGPAMAAVHEDIDQNGQVDIRDAFLLARHLATGESSRQQWDVNGDGTVDRADVDTIALAAVKLDGGTYQ